MIIDEKEIKKRHLLRIAGVRDNKVYTGPELVSLDISNTCNLACRHCWIHAPGNPAHSQEVSFLSWKKFLEIVSDCIDLKVDHLQITAAGEPTVNPLFRDMMGHLGQQPVYVSLFTNATFSLEYCSDAIKADCVLIDLSAVNRQSYKAVHGQDLFDRVIENIKRLVSLRDVCKPEFVIEIVYVINSLNVEQRQEMKMLADKLNVNQVCFKKMVVDEYNKEVALPEEGLPELESEKKSALSACLNGWFYLRVRSDYDVSSCCRIPDMSIGGFEKKSLKQIWLSKRMMKMRLLEKFGHVQRKYKACQSCPFFEENTRRFCDLAGNE